MTETVSTPKQPDNTFGLLIIGAGPAGLAPLLAAARNGLLPHVLSTGVLLVDRAHEPGAGRLGNYIITSDSSADTFLSCVRNSPVPELAVLAETPLAQEVAAYGADCVPLELAGRLMAEVGKAMANLIARSPHGRVAMGTEVDRLDENVDGSWTAQLRDVQTGRTETVKAASILVATGATQEPARLQHLPVGGAPLLPRYENKLIQSDEFLSHDGFARTIAALTAMDSPKVAIVGGSTSAMSCARQILIALEGHTPPVHVTLLHRHPMTIFYPGRDAAHADGYTSFDERDICALSGFVHRFGGFRFESRILARQLLGVGDAPPEPRMSLHQLQEGNDAEARRILDNADLVIACLGYRPAAVPIRDRTGALLPLAAQEEGRPLVNDACEVIAADATPIPGLFGIGLACGYRPPIEMGGERSFSGQVNGLWLWQNDVGLMLIRRLLAYSGNLPPEEAAHAA
ncbi:DegT/DnrJ/EryC1/StrS aminotransferase [Acetobacter estunensis NRIC 0472]|nr:FAD-dependent oxidoreductase [Acetobacter estunensis]GBQ28561.1 DegT/DnrJ/EryC1/StrS aminotransferase [Acetobacter estunensis NRIC 0472]